MVDMIRATDVHPGEGRSNGKGRGLWCLCVIGAQGYRAKYQVRMVGCRAGVQEGWQIGQGLQGWGEGGLAGWTGPAGLG